MQGAKPTGNIAVDAVGDPAVPLTRLIQASPSAMVRLLARNHGGLTASPQPLSATISMVQLMLQSPP